MLFNETTPEKDFPARCVEKLLGCIKSAGKIKSRYSARQWAGEFRRLEKIDGIPPAQIRRVLNFLIANYSEGLPRIYSAAGFRRKFGLLENLMHRDPHKPPEIEITPVAYEIIKSQGTPIWKYKQDKTECPTFVQLTYNRYEKFCKQLRAAADRADAELTARQDAQERRSGVVTRRPDELAPLLRSYARRLPDAFEFAGAWLFRFAEIAHKSENWEPGLLKCAWQPRNKFWRRNMERHAGEFSGNPADWLRVLDYCGL